MYGWCVLFYGELYNWMDIWGVKIKRDPRKNLFLSRQDNRKEVAGWKWGRMKVMNHTLRIKAVLTNLLDFRQILGFYGKNANNANNVTVPFLGEGLGAKTWCKSWWVPGINGNWTIYNLIYLLTMYLYQWVNNHFFIDRIKLRRLLTI